MILMIDNYDSFVYNLYQYFLILGAEVEVVRNDRISMKDIARKKPQAIVISPGPCSPAEAGVSVETIQTFYQTTPILGICLGHQAIGHALGGEVIRAPRVMHGKTSLVDHDDQGVFKNIPQPCEVMRYHSLVVKEESLPEGLLISAKSQDDAQIMGLRHKDYPLEGIQFHPESILTKSGMDMLHNFLKGLSS